VSCDGRSGTRAPAYGGIDTIVGPDTLTKRQQIAAIGAAIGADLQVDQVRPEQAREFLSSPGRFAAANADFLFGFESYDGVPGATDEPHDTSVDPSGPYLTIAESLGRPARSYAAWARDYAADFSWSGSPEEVVVKGAGDRPCPIGPVGDDRMDGV
jgi:hypothetical protein